MTKPHHMITRFLLLALLLQFASGGRLLHIHTDAQRGDHAHVTLTACDGAASDGQACEHSHAKSEAGHQQCDQHLHADAREGDQQPKPGQRSLDQKHHHHCLTDCVRSMPLEIASSDASVDLEELAVASFPATSSQALAQAHHQAITAHQRSRPPPIGEQSEHPCGGRSVIARIQQFLL